MTAPRAGTAWPRCERLVEGWVDCPHDDALAITVRLEDLDRAVETCVVARPSPSYEIRTVRGHALRGDVDPASLTGLAALAGTAMVSGLTRRVREAVGTGAGSSLVIDAIVEVARLARQVVRLPRDRAERAVADGARGCWELDRASWVDLPDSCFTYSAAGGALFDTRTVATLTVADLYSPRPGQRRVFDRRKVARVEPHGDRLALFHSMYDNVHGFEITCDVELPSGRIVRAESRTPRLPYAGICSEPQGRIQSLVGETLDVGLIRRIQSLLGGASGCAQLYDLTLDLLKLLPLPPTPRP